MYLLMLSPGGGVWGVTVQARGDFDIFREKSKSPDTIPGQHIGRCIKVQLLGVKKTHE